MPSSRPVTSTLSSLEPVFDRALHRLPARERRLGPGGGGSRNTTAVLVVGRREAAVHLDHVLVEVGLRLARVGERVDRIGRGDDPAVRDELPVGDLDADDDRADPYEAA